MSGSIETADSIKDDKVTNPTLDKGGWVKEMETGNRRGNQSRRRTELVQLHTVNRYFKGDTPELGAVLRLLS